MKLGVYVKAEYYLHQPAREAALQVNSVAIENGWDVPNDDKIFDFYNKILDEIRKQPEEICGMLMICGE